MNELINQVSQLITGIPTFVWVIAGILLLMFAVVGITILVMIIKFLRGKNGVNLIRCIKRIVSRGFGQAKSFIRKEIEAMEEEEKTKPVVDIE